MRFRLIVLALGTFAIGTGSFVFAGPLEGVARTSRSRWWRSSLLLMR